MDQAFPSRTHSTVRRRSPWVVISAVVLAAFLLGAAAAWYLLRPGDLDALDLVSIREAPAAPPPSTLELDPGQEAALERRIAEMEQRLARIDVQADEAAGNATRAEGLLIAFAARRAVERGDALGYLAREVQTRFGVAEPDAVSTVLAAERDPVTLDQLLARLDGLGPHLGQAPAQEGMMTWISRELGDLFVVRREDAPSPAPERRLERARQFLESGRADAAVQEVQNLPNVAGTAEWIAAAQRYAAAQRALERLEAAAILEPRDLRDGAGESLQQARLESPTVQR